MLEVIGFITVVYALIGIVVLVVGNLYNKEFHKTFVEDVTELWSLSFVQTALYIPCVLLAWPLLLIKFKPE